MKSPDRKIASFISIICLSFLMISASHATKIDVANSQDSEGEIATQSQKWEGVWFTCEHAQRQRAPDDACDMFDNEGFEYRNGTLSYLEMKGSQETNCRGQKQGHCFARKRPAITVSTKPIGDARIEDGLLIVRYWGCEQSFFMTQGADFMTIKPKGKNCLWSQERHFYIAPYLGKVSY